jgi:hypothetical protein
MNRLLTIQRARVITSDVEGNCIHATVRMTGVCKHAVLKLICDFGKICTAHHNRAVRNVASERVRHDEVWAFCYAKAKYGPEEKQGIGAGDLLTWAARVIQNSPLPGCDLRGSRSMGFEVVSRDFKLVSFARLVAYTKTIATKVGERFKCPRTRRNHLPVMMNRDPFRNF